MPSIKKYFPLLVGAVLITFLRDCGVQQHQ